MCLGHLGYASTAYGVQGVTVEGAHPVLDEATSAADLYVGLTCGTDKNTLHLIAENADQARDQFIQAMTRDRAHRGLTAATTEAQDAVHGIITDGPVAIVNTERARLIDASSQTSKPFRPSKQCNSSGSSGLKSKRIAWRPSEPTLNARSNSRHLKGRPVTGMDHSLNAESDTDLRKLNTSGLIPHSFGLDRWTHA